MARSFFRNTALLSNLVTQEQLDNALSAVRQSEDQPSLPLVDVDDSALAAKLVEMGVLTAYQAEQIKSGRTKFELGPYTITEFIGQGGMGQVYKGVHKVMGRESAIKVLPLTKSTPESINNFMREIRMQAQLDHPNLVRAYDAGRDGNVHYLVTEYISGTDLRRLVRSEGPLTQQQAASVILQAAKGLDYAHKRGLIHRDVKPGNILVTSEGIAKVSDLGLAGFMQSTEHDPRAGKVVGTPDYLSPEQIRSPGDVGPPSDIYSLGCTLYYAVCGKVPYPGGTAREKARRHCEETPWHPRRFNLELNEEFVDVIADMMEKDAKQRIQTAAEVVARLEQWAGDTNPIGSRTEIRSPWTAPPVPTEADDEPRGADLPQDTDGDFSASVDASQGSSSQGTHGLTAQDTLPSRPPRRTKSGVLASIGPTVPLTTVVVMLAASVVVSMLAGALLASFLFWLFR